jgi:hypothetical protein
MSDKEDESLWEETEEIVEEDEEFNDSTDIILDGQLDSVLPKKKKVPLYSGYSGYSGYSDNYKDVYGTDTYSGDGYGGGTISDDKYADYYIKLMESDPSKVSIVAAGETRGVIEAIIEKLLLR